MIFKLIQYLIGAVRLRIEGDFPERLLNLCIAKRILLWDITKNSNNNIYCWMRLPDFFRIRPLVRKSHTHLTVLERCGLPFRIKQVKARPMLVGGIILCTLLLYCAGEYVWFVNISGPTNISGEAIREVAFRQGLRPGVLKSSIDRKGVEQAIVLELPEVAWVGIDFTGTRALIEVVAKTMPGYDDRSPAHIVAAKDGTITEIIVLSGQGIISKGKAVKKGDILIAGTEVGPERLRRASGIAQARVLYETEAQWPLIEVEKHPTGHKRLAVELKAGDWKFVLPWSAEPPYENFETGVIYKKAVRWRNSDFIVETTIKLYSEYVADTLEITPEAARGQAWDQARAELQLLLPEDAQILSQTTEILPIAEPGIIKVRVKLETRENIGQVMHITP